MLADELRQGFLTKDLTDQQLAALVAAGEEMSADDGEVLFHEGEPSENMWILLDGTVELSRKSGNTSSVFVTMTTPGQWSGGHAAWSADGSGYRATGTVVGSARVLRVPSTELSRLVGEWLPFAKHIIMGVYNTVRSLEASAQHRDSLVALGTLSAGLAHEINNPAAASLRAVEALRATCDTMLGNLTTLATKTISADQFMELDRLRRELLDLPISTTDVLAMMNREESIALWLERHQVDQPWELAPALAAVGADGTWLNSVEKAVGAEALTPALRWASTTFSAASLLSELTDTTNRISNLVGAVRSYTQMDRAERQRFDVHEGLENTLVMLAPKLAKVRVAREFGGVPQIEGFPAELNQVWTNLIDNAVDAMDGAGRLRIATRLEGDHLVVSIADTGPGMPPDVQARAFEPFFTTKDVGKGTGLGLDISRRIVVERHKGDITFESSPEGTTAIVSLPLGG